MTKEVTLKTVVNDATGMATANNLLRLRELAGISRAELSRKLKDHGVRMSESAIGRVERRQRRLELGELTALAYALERSPIDFLAPADSELTGVPSGHYTSEEIRAWLQGKTKLSPGALVGYWAQEAERAQQTLLASEKALDTFTDLEGGNIYLKTANEEIARQKERIEKATENMAKARKMLKDEARDQLLSLDPNIDLTVD